MTKEVYEFLGKPKRIRRQIQRLDAEMEGLQLAMLPGGIRYDTDRVQTTPRNKMDEYAIRLDPFLKRRRTLQAEYCQAIDDIKAVSDKLGEVEGNIIVMKYVASYSFEKIADSFPMSERQMFRYYRKALSDISELIKRCQ